MNPAVLKPGEVGEITVKDLWKFSLGEHVIKVVSGSGIAMAEKEVIELVPNPSAVLVYTFDEGTVSGNKVYDLSGNGNDGTIYGAKIVKGKFGNALSFDGVDDYVMVSCPKQLSGDVSFTVSFWLKYNIQPKREWIMDFGNRASPVYTTVHFLIQPSYLTQFGFWAGTQNKFDISSKENKWVEVVTTYDSSTKHLKTWFDGKKVDEDVVRGTVNLQPNTLYIGFPLSTESYFKGYLIN